MKESQNSSPPGLVSVIVPTRNSGKTIRTCISSINQQTYENIELIVIDGLSTDDTVSICRSMGARVIELDGERTKAKNYGISLSHGEFVFFIDSDMELQPKVIEECAKICSVDAQIAGVIIPERSVGCGFWVRVRDFERSFYSDSVIESARFFRRKCVLDVGGFDDRYIFYEESTLHQRIKGLGLKVNRCISSSILHHEDDFDLKRWLYKKRYYMESAKKYSEQYMEYAKLQNSIGHRIDLFTKNGRWKKLVRHPFMAIGLFTLKSLELLFSKL